jgi:hypothetical protein
MRLDWVRLTLRLHRFELFAFGAAIATLVVASFVAAAYIDSLRPAPDCYAIAGALPPACVEAVRRFYEAQQTLGGLLLTPLLFVTYAIGLFLGVPIVARELERGTVRLAWSLAPSRWRWYVARMVPILVVLVVLTFAAGVAADRLVAASTPGAPGADLSSSFNGYGNRGGLLASRAVFIFAVSVVVGSFLGRALPAVIVAALVAAIGLFGGIEVHHKILQGEAVTIPMDNGGPGPDDLFFDQRFVLPDGTLVGYDYFNGTDPFDPTTGTSKYPMVALVVPGGRYRFVETREALVLAGGSLAGLALAGVVVSKRRPG